MRQQQRCLISLRAEIELKVNDGTQRTLVSVRVSESLTVPMWAIEATAPFGRWTVVEMVAVIVVKKEIEQTIWSVAPVSTIHGGLLKEWKLEWWENREEKTEYW